MAMFHLLKIRTSIDIFKNEKCKVTFGLEYISVTFCALIQLAKYEEERAISWVDRSPGCRVAYKG